VDTDRNSVRSPTWPAHTERATAWSSRLDQSEPALAAYRLVRFMRKFLFALGGTVYLFTVGLASSRHRLLIGTIANHFGYFRSQLPAADVSDVLPAVVDVRLSELDSVDGNVSPLELLVLCGMIQKYRPHRVLEIGTFDGRTTLNFAMNSPPDTRIYTLDLPKTSGDSTALRLDRTDMRYIDKDAPGARFRGTTYKRKITQLLGDSARFDFASLRAVDFVFVDGAHSRGYVINDSLRAVELIRDKGGCVVWHDYRSNTGVTEALEELHASNESFAALQYIDHTSLAYLTISAHGSSG